VTVRTYTEARPASDLNEYVECVWYRRVSPDEAERPARVLPDGCMDLIWVEHELVIAGPDTSAWTGNLARGDNIVGIRFHPGVAPALLGVPATELRDRRTPVRLVSRDWAEDLDTRLSDRADPRLIGDQLQASLQDRLRKLADVDAAVQHVASALRRSDPGVPNAVERMAEQIGLSERQLHRRCLDALGYGPKTLARIIRFQRFLSRAERRGPISMAWLAADCGYADQAHLTREVKQLSGLPPARLLAERRLISNE
jgi:AraC-like DNA-binding protein